MTRDEAIKIYKERYKTTSTAEVAIDTLEALGILKLDEPKTATERALDSINDYKPLYGKIPNGEILITLLNAAGVRIVDK